MTSQKRTGGGSESSPVIPKRSSRSGHSGVGRGTLAALLAAFFLLGACSGFTSKVSRRFGGKVSFDVEIDARLNQDFPLAVDFVVVYDKDLFAELGKLSAADWFALRDQYRADGEPANLEVRSWEWVPRAPCPGCPDPEPQVVDYRLGAHGGIVFSDYFNAGIHRVVIEPLAPFVLELGETEATVRPVEGGKAAKKEAKKRKKAEKKKKKEERKKKKSS